MTTKYIFNGINSALLAIRHISFSAPVPKEAPMLNSPAQMLTTFPDKREVIDFSEAAPVLELVNNLHWLETVKTISVRQPGYLLLAPHAGIGQKTEGIADQRYGMIAYPEDRARESYVYGGLHAPARLQSVPGYTIGQSQVTRSSQGYPKSAGKAPRPKVGGGGCTS